MTTASFAPSSAVRVVGPGVPGGERVLTSEALAFVASLERRFRARRKRLLHRRELVQRKLDGGWKPDFLVRTAGIRAADWTVAPMPDDLLDRRVEITGPVDRKMIINALNSRRERASWRTSRTRNSPDLGELPSRGRSTCATPSAARSSSRVAETGKHYTLERATAATLVVRPRGWHLVEKHFLVDGKPVPAGALRLRLLLLPQRAASS